MVAVSLCEGPAGRGEKSGCPACGLKRAEQLMVCTHCGHSWGCLRRNATKRAEEVERRTRLEVVYTNRGGRSAKATYRRKFRKYWRRAISLGYDTVTERFADDRQFEQQLAAQGWSIGTIRNIDWGARESAATGWRSSEQIYAAGRYVYRGKRFATEDESWDQAHLYDRGQASEHYHWQRAKKGRGGAP